MSSNKWNQELKSQYPIKEVFLTANYGTEFRDACIRLSDCNEKLEKNVKRHNWRSKVRGRRRYL